MKELLPILLVAGVGYYLYQSRTQLDQMPTSAHSTMTVDPNPQPFAGTGGNPRGLLGGAWA